MTRWDVFLGHSVQLLHTVVTLALDTRTYFVTAGSTSVSLPPRLCIWLPVLASDLQCVSHLSARRRLLHSPVD